MADPRLLVVVNVFHPDRGGGAAVFSDMCYALEERGFDVTVRCAYPYYPEWTDKSGSNGWNVQRYTDRGVEIERHGLFIPRDPNSLFQRLLYEASFFLSLARSLVNDDAYDVVMVFCPLVGAVGYAGLRRLIYDDPLWLNVQDLSAEAAKAGGISTSDRLYRLLARVQRWLFNQADVWSSISPEMVEYLRPMRSRSQPLLYIPNWLNTSMAEVIEDLPEKVGRRPATPVRLLYAGNIGSKQDLLAFCRKLHASDAPFFFQIHGNGSEAERIERWVDSVDDDRFGFGPFLPEDEFVRAIHESDYFLITERSGTGGSFIPSKMIPGMATGTPILAVSDPDSPLGQEMHRAEPGPWFSWDDLDEIPNLLRRTAAENVPFVNWQENARQRATFYERDSVLDRMESVLRRMTTDQPLSSTHSLSTDA